MLCALCMFTHVYTFMYVHDAINILSSRRCAAGVQLEVETPMIHASGLSP